MPEIQLLRPCFSYSGGFWLPLEFNNNWRLRGMTTLNFIWALCSWRAVIIEQFPTLLCSGRWLAVKDRPVLAGWTHLHTYHDSLVYLPLWSPGQSQTVRTENSQLCLRGADFVWSRGWKIPCLGVLLKIRRFWSKATKRALIAPWYSSNKQNDRACRSLIGKKQGKRQPRKMLRSTVGVRKSVCKC